MTLYEFYFDTERKIYEWLLTQPNLVFVNNPSGHIIACEFNHNAAQETAFKQEMASRFFQVVINETSENMTNKLKELATDQLLWTTSRQVTKTNIGSTFTNLFTDFSGRPFFADMTGFTKMAFQTFWTKIGTGNQHIRIIDDSGTITSDLINTESLGGGSGLSTGDNALANFTIPANYIDFRGKLRIQVRSTVAADDPVFEGINIYLRR